MKSLSYRERKKRMRVLGKTDYMWTDTEWRYCTKIATRCGKDMFSSRIYLIYRPRTFRTESGELKGFIICRYNLKDIHNANDIAMAEEKKIALLM